MTITGTEQWSKKATVDLVCLRVSGICLDYKLRGETPPRDVVLAAIDLLEHWSMVTPRLMTHYRAMHGSKIQHGKQAYDAMTEFKEAFSQENATATPERLQASARPLSITKNSCAAHFRKQRTSGPGPRAPGPGPGPRAPGPEGIFRGAAQP